MQALAGIPIAESTRRGRCPQPRIAGRSWAVRGPCVVLAWLIWGGSIQAQPRVGTMTDSAKAVRWATENELQSIAHVERKTMIPMRDGVRIAADIYYPKGGGKYPTIWSRTPYNFHWFDTQNGVPRDMAGVTDYIRRGYAYVQIQERGRYWSEGNYEILGAPVSDGEDEVRWMTTQPWSNGKVGATGCSSTAEWQGAVAALGTPGFAAINPQGFGAGVGRVGPYYEQGNWFRGGAFQPLFGAWLHDEQNPIRPQMPREATREQLVHASRWFDLVPRFPRPDYRKAYGTLPIMDMLKAIGGPPGQFADSMPIPGGGAMIRRTPNDTAWYKGGLFHDDMRINIPGLWFASWYDVSVAPNLEMYNHVRRTATGEAADQQWLIVAPTDHCGFTRSRERTIVGERDMGDARLDYDAIVNGFFDRFLKGSGGAVLDSLPKVLYYTMGRNEWQRSDVWPPRDARPMTFYLSSGGRANTLHGDGVLLTRRPGPRVPPDSFTYDPMNPVPSHGGNICCMTDVIAAGAFDQRKVEERQDVLVYTSEPFTDGLEVTGTIVPTLYVSSDAKDTDFTIKVVDVYPDGRAYNLDESIQRMRYRDGYDKPQVWMEKGQVVKVQFQPLMTSNYFAPGHRLRIEISSSNFPRFDRNLNTGGNNYDEAVGVATRNAVHHSSAYPSSITVSVIKR
jgi:uncharacterized protein